jgi:hypothetical protein
MEIDLRKDLNFKFLEKPLLVGGRAKEFYGIRKSGQDVDFVISKKDHSRLEKELIKRGLVKIKGRNKPGYKKVPQLVDLYGDHGLLIYNYEIWDTICKFDYSFLAADAIEKENFLIISLEKLLFLTSLAVKKPKYANDLKLIIKKVLDNQYKK